MRGARHDARCRRPRAAPAGATVALLATAACSGQQSALDPAGPGAQLLANLFWGMAVGAVVVWVVVVGITVHAVYWPQRARSRSSGRLLIVGGGVTLPTAVLAALLAYGLGLLPEALADAPPGSVTIDVTGHQWWWRVRYPDEGGAPIELANEIHLPVGEPVQFRLGSADVIHSFWIPALGGKVDMIPGRITRLQLRASRTGTFRGVCAEYCGTSHAWMAFVVVVHERDEFDRWLARQREPARAPAGAEAERGAEVFVASGCGACHTVRGTLADGVLAPDLTHVGSRRSLAAGTLGNGAANLRRWIERPAAVKPGALMPAFGMLPDEDLRALAAYLEGLQ